jgi:chemotaxis protein methyltransferase WspC
VVTETWFFREKHPFAALARLVTEEWLPAHPAEALRLLSVPCASGEEPYSMAMTLLDAGVPASRFLIDAVDLSARALAFAQRALYGRNSFRGAELDFRNRYFRPARGGYVLNPEVRRLVRFERGNILSDSCLPGAGIYDFIFCRNLLIYFDRPTQDETLAKLRRLLAAGGALFTGAAELPLALENGFVALDYSRGFACRKVVVPAKPKPARRLTVAAVGKTPTPGQPSSAAGPGSDSRSEANAEALAAPQVPSRANLEKAREFAAQGRFAEATELCEAHLREYGTSAEAYCILGLIQDASGVDAQADECYRKALYLEPDHLETLRQWALLSERNGRREHARRLRQRADRRYPDQTPQLWTL